MYIYIYIYIYVYVYVYIYIDYTYIYPSDPINDLCSFTGKRISGKYFTYCSLQRIKIFFREFYAPGSDPPHKVVRY